ncbi:hypothetical protein Prubr_62570 [Polymorphospora rubra]|uniref:Uncharacterized protein n=1 Tax=Polymorphospora rubra TaxID=338584 RepID=A0A810N761_9ACTN|nr:hypothetical protein Prubr_62570 [Polymorphospora rubra]
MNTVWSNSSASGDPASANNTSRNPPGNRPSNSPHTSSNAAANTGNDAYNSRPMPARCAPCPENNTASGPRSPARPVTASDGEPSASAANPAARSSRSATSSTARWSRADREVTVDQATSHGSGAWPVASHRDQRAACRGSPSSPRAESSTGTSGGVAVATGSSLSASGVGCSMITWAFVPLTPNEETAARRGRSSAGHGWASVSRETAPADQSTCGVGSSTCRVRGSTPCRIAITILITPATPAAAWVCPMFDLTDPSHNGRSAGRSCPYVAINACASIGSPRVVAVPWASTASTSAGVRAAVASACRITRCWAGPFGAVRPLDAPSWLTAEPRITARTRRPSRRASDSRCTSSAPTPSPQPVPSADAANDRHRPSAASPPCRENSTNAPGVTRTFTPPATARSHSPARSACTARCSATSDDEQAVSTVTAGPSSPNVYATRPEMTLCAPPVNR